MDFTPTADQELLRDTARALLRNECPPSVLRAHMGDPTAADPLWAHLREFAPLAAHDCTDLCLFLDETGHVAAPGPFLASVALCAPLLAACGAPAFDALAAGESTGTVAMAGAGGAWRVADDPVKTFVPEADRADVVAVVGPGPTVTVVERPPVATLRFVATVDTTRRLFEVDTSSLRGDRFPLTDDALRAWLDRAHLAVAAEHLGTTRRIFTMSLEYAKSRVQFDVPIGSFQAIQHKLAEMALGLERATAAVHYAAMTVDAADADRTRACHVAKAAVAEAARRILKDGAQIHGGIGYTWEHDLHLFLRRAVLDGHLMGTASYHHDRLADLLFTHR